ncbi:hypothetical protein HPB50_029059 [Hyalomma asiaticum]|nr:hypothetical protein HPB50_029059 [Hyalomma asiaticum]
MPLPPQPPSAETTDNTSGDQAPAGASTSPMEVFEGTGEDVHLGSGIMVKAHKLNYIMRSRNVTKVARDMARFFWTPSELQVRSLTGQPCRRLADSVAKQQATPEKAEAIMNMLFI